MRWFHGTSKQNAEKILKEGVLKPGQDTVYDIDIPRDNAVYIADWDIAHQYALERGGVILEVATPNPKKLIPDEDDVYELLSDHKGHLNTQGQGLQKRIQALWLQKWNEENAAYRTEYSEEQFPHYENFEQAWKAWGEIEFEGSAELAEQMKDLTDYIVKKDPALAQAIIQMSGKAAHLGPIKIIGKAQKQAAAAQIEKLQQGDIEEALQVGSACFPYDRKMFEGISRSELDNDFSQSYVAKINGKIVGGYFLGKHQLPEQYSAPETQPYEGKNGIEGVALFVLPEHQGTGIGRQLRAIPLSLGADYIWGQHFEDLNNLQNWVNFGRKHLFTIGDVHVTVMDLKPEKTAAKKPEYIKTVGFVIEVPQERRKTFWTRPEGKLEYWAFKNRPRAFNSEPIIFTFDRKPVAQAVVLRVEAPGKGTGEYKDWHKLYWNPTTFVKYRNVTASAKKAGWIGPVYHGSYAGFSGNPKGDPETGGMTYFTDSAEYAGYFSSSHGQYQPNSAIYPAYIRLNKPFDARDWSDQKLTIEEYAKAIGATKAALLNEIPTLPTETWFWRYLLMTPHTSKAALKKQGYDSIIQLEAEDRGQTPHTTSFVVFNNTQIKSYTGEKAPKKVLDLTGKKAAVKELYHVTLQKNLDDILEEGLKAEHGYQFFDDIPKATYLTDRKGLPFWKDEVASYYGDPQVVLKVNTQGLNLIPDEFGTNDAGAPAYRVEEDIPPSRIKVAAASISQLAMDIEKLHDEIKNNPAYEMVRPSDRQQVDLLRLMMRNIPVMLQMAKSFGKGKLLKVKWNPEREETIGTQIEYWTDMFNALKEQADQPGVLRDAQRVIQLIAQFDEIVYSIHRLIEMLVDKPSRYFRRTSAAPAPARQKVTDTPEFKRWFGNSKVVDANGEPLVVYHGSTRDYDTFSLTYPYRWEWTPIKDLGYVGRGEGRSEAIIFNNKQNGTFSLYPDGGEFNTAEEAIKKVDTERPKEGKLSMRPGFFFAANPMYTRDFVKSYDGQGGVDYEGGNVKPCYLKMENPLDFRLPASRRWVRQWLREHREQMGELDVNHIYKMFREGNWAFVEGLESVMSDEQINPAQIVSDIKAAGFDGYINVEGGTLRFVEQSDADYDARAKEMYGRGGLDSTIVYVVWDSTQIKSAIGNSGAFDPKSPSITAAVKTQPMDADWKKRVQDTNAPALKDPALAKLHALLLKHGGEEAIVGSQTFPAEEIQRLLTRGKYWDGKAKFKKMRAINCHGNSRCLMEQGLGEVANGFALSKDGLWRPHSWLVTPTGLIETTVPRAAYFGAVLTKDEVEKEYEGHYASFEATVKTADHINDEGFWAGEGNAASGVLPVCPTTGNVCLAMRSSEVLSPNCWGTIGGAVQRGMSPQESAKTEMQEETGYHGGITLIPAFVFAAAGGFKYHNFIGVVSNEFAFHPSEEHSWETDFIQWIPYADVVKDMQTNPSDYHPGLIALFKNSKQAIERVMKIKEEPEEPQEKTSASTSPQLEAFMDDFRAGTGQNPLGMRDRVWGENVVIEVRPFDGKIHISDIMSLERGAGNASKALDWLCSLADKHGVKMSLTPDSYGDGQGLDNDQLAAWYAKRGFKFVRGQLMVREPKTTLKLGPNMKTIPMDKQSWDEISYSSPKGTLLGGVLESDDEIKQWAREYQVDGRTLRMLKGKRLGVIDDMRVTERGEGYGTKLLTRLVREAKAKGCDAVMLAAGVLEKQDKGFDLVKWYESHGFKTIAQGKWLPIMIKWLPSSKKAALTFQDTNRGYHNDQADQTLTALVDGKPVGYMEYAVYQDEPSVQWLEVFDKRKGYGTALLKELQRMYPDVEVDLGMLTDEGGKLIDSMKFNEQPTEYAAKFDELEQLIKERDKLQQVADDFYAKENHSEEEKQSFMRQMENMNNIHDRIWELEQETGRQKRTKRYIAAEQQHLFPGSRDANFQAWFKGSKVVDKDGKPQPVYHGTRSSVDFDSFSVDGPPVDDSDYEGQPMSSGSGADPTAMMGAHFAVQPEVASQFATPARGRWQSTRYEGENEMPRVIQVFLRITNPKDFGSEHNLREFINQGKVTGDALDIAMQGDGIQPYENEEAASEWYQKYENDQSFRTEKNRYLFEQAPGGEGYDDELRDAAYELAAQARGRLEAAGHDGIHYKNVVEGGTAWIIFDPRQAKSVWAQSFNPIDPRFTASVESDATEIKIVPKSKGLESEAWYEGERVGFVYLHRMEDAPGNPRAPKNSLMVDAAALAQHLKGKSIGLKMYRAGIDAAREAGYERVYEGIEHSEDAANLWERLKQLYPTEFDEDWGVNYIPLKQSKTGAMLRMGSKATVLYLDDTRKPLRPGVAWVKNYTEFVNYLKNHEMPDVISFDHDLALEHYPANWEEARDRFTEGIPYNTYHEKTGLDAAEWLVQQQLPIGFWAVHSANPVGRENIRQVLKFYRPDGEVQPNVPFINQEKSVYGGKVEGGFRVEPWEKKAAGFAFRSFKKLWHVGDMNPQSKRPGSYEGSGLSVSVNPEEWQYIAGIGGDLWELTKQGNRFLNFHRISKAQRKQITEWGIKQGYVEPITMWRAEWYDDEMEDTRYSDFLTEQEAQEELESYGEGKVYEVPESLNPTPKLLSRAQAGGGDNTMMAWDYLVIIYAEDMLQCDGVWWDDKLDQYALSAPRGVIFKDKLPSWKMKKVRQAAAPPKPTTTQLEVLKGMMSGDGTIHREKGGFWLWWTPAGYDKWGSPLREGETSTLGREGVSWCDIRTVRAMEKRGWVERTMRFPEEWRDPRKITDAGQLLLMPAKTSADRSWSREQAEDFVKNTPFAEAGYSAKIVGGVAINGRSSHDLDILLTPTTNDFDFEKLMNYFAGVGADQQPTYDGEEEVWEVRLPSGQIVDFFFTADEPVSPVN